MNDDSTTTDDPQDGQGQVEGNTESTAGSAQTVETQTVEEANAAYAGGSADDQKADGGADEATSTTADSAGDESGDGSDHSAANSGDNQSDDEAAESTPPLPTENAPAFQAPAEEVSVEPIVLPADPDGSIILTVTRDALFNLMPRENNGAIYDLLSGVARNDTTVRAVSIVLERVLRHPNARAISTQSDASVIHKTMNDVLQGNESEHFASHGLDEGGLCEFFRHVTPEAVVLVDKLPAAV